MKLILILFESYRVDDFFSFRKPLLIYLFNVHFVILTLWRAAAFGIFEKNAKTHVALHGNFSALVRVTDLVEVTKDAESLLVCTQKILLLGVCWFFCK